MILKRIVLSAIAIGLGLPVGSVAAQTYPDRPIRLIVPFQAN